MKREYCDEKDKTYNYKIMRKISNDRKNGRNKQRKSLEMLLKTLQGFENIS